MSKSWEKGSTSEWRRVRAHVLQANRLANAGRCNLKLDVCTTHATQVHHTLGRAVTGDDPRYLMAVCAACNYKLGDPSKHKEQASKPLSHWL